MKHRRKRAILICFIVFLFTIPIFFITDGKIWSAALIFALIIAYRSVMRKAPYTKEEIRQYQIISDYKDKLLGMTDKLSIEGMLKEIGYTTKGFYEEYNYDLQLVIDEVRFRFGIEDNNTIIIDPPKGISPFSCPKCNKKIGITYKSLDDKKLSCPECNALIIWGVPKFKKVIKEDTYIEEINN